MSEWGNTATATGDVDGFVDWRADALAVSRGPSEGPENGPAVPRAGMRGEGEGRVRVRAACCAASYCVLCDVHVWLCAV
jgi:hypothetical protein